MDHIGIRYESWLHISVELWGRSFWVSVKFINYAHFNHLSLDQYAHKPSNLTTLEMPRRNIEATLSAESGSSKDPWCIFTGVTGKCKLQRVVDSGQLYLTRLVDLTLSPSKTYHLIANFSIYDFEQAFNTSTDGIM